MKNVIYQFFRRPLIAIPVTGVIILFATWGIVGRMQSLPPYSYTTVTHGSVSGTITLSGTVAPSDEIDLAFLNSGTVASVSAHTGAKVSRGDILVALSSQNSLGLVNQAKGALESAKANLEAQQAKLEGLESGARPEDIALYKQKYADASSALIIAMNNAYLQTDSAILRYADTLFTNGSTANPVIKVSTQSWDEERSVETDRIIVGEKLNKWQTAVADLNSSSDETTISDARIIVRDAITFTTNFLDHLGTITSNLNSNVSGMSQSDIATYQSNVNTAAQAVSTAASAEQTAYASWTSASQTLVSEQAGSKSTDIQAQQAAVDAAQASIDTADGAYQSAQSTYDNNFIKAPINGTITFVNVEVGQNATPNQTVIGMVSTGAFQMVAYVDQDFLSRLPLGTQVDVTFTEIPGTTFSARVVDTESGSAVAQSSAQYKVTFELDGTDSRINTGLNASISLIGTDRENVLVVPRSALLMQNGSYFVLVKKGGSLVGTPISVGLVGTEKVEVTSGIVEGDTVALIGL